MRVCELSNSVKEKDVVINIDNMPLHIKQTEILETVEGHIFDILYRKYYEVYRERLEEGKKAPNTIAMSTLLYRYLYFLCQKERNEMRYDNAFDRKAATLFDLKVVVRDDYDMDEIDIYRDISDEVI